MKSTHSETYLTFLITYTFFPSCSVVVIELFLNANEKDKYQQSEFFFS